LHSSLSKVYPKKELADSVADQRRAAAEKGPAAQRANPRQSKLTNIFKHGGFVNAAINATNSTFSFAPPVASKDSLETKNEFKGEETTDPIAVPPSQRSSANDSRPEANPPVRSNAAHATPPSYALASGATGVFDPAQIAALNAEKRAAWRPKSFAAPPSIPAHSALNQEAICIKLTPLHSPTSLSIADPRRLALKELLSFGTNKAAGRRAAFAKFLLRLGVTENHGINFQQIESVEYSRVLTAVARPNDGAMDLDTSNPNHPNAGTNRRVPFTPSIDLIKTQALQHPIFITVRLSRPSGTDVPSSAQVFSAELDRSNSQNSAETLLAFFKTLLQREDLRSFLSAEDILDVDWIHLRFKLPSLAGIPALQDQLAAKGLPPNRCVILNADDGCIPRGPSTAIYRPEIAIPASLLPVAKRALADWRPELLHQPPPFCSGCGEIGVRAKECKRCSPLPPDAHLCLCCQRPLNVHAAADRALNAAGKLHCIHPRTGPCFLCGAAHSPFQCPSGFRPSWRPLAADPSQHQNLHPARNNLRRNHISAPAQATATRPQAPAARTYSNAVSPSAPAGLIPLPASFSARSPGSNPLPAVPRNAPDGSADLRAENQLLKTQIKNLQAENQQIKQQLNEIQASLNRLLAHSGLSTPAAPLQAAAHRPSHTPLARRTEFITVHSKKTSAAQKRRLNAPQSPPPATGHAEDDPIAPAQSQANDIIETPNPYSALAADEMQTEAAGRSES
jgi:hypothetical protein